MNLDLIRWFTTHHFDTVEGGLLQDTVEKGVVGLSQESCDVVPSRTLKQQAKNAGFLIYYHNYILIIILLSLLLYIYIYIYTHTQFIHIYYIYIHPHNS